MNLIKIILKFYVILLLMLFVSCNEKKIIKNREIVNQKKEVVNNKDKITEKATNDIDILELNGTYEIKTASSLIFNKNMEIVETTKIGMKIYINNNTALFDNDEYIIISNYKEFPWSMSDNKITQREFHGFWSSMNYGVFDMTIIDPNFNTYIIDPNLYIINREYEENLPKNVFVRLLKNTKNEYMVFFIENKLIIEASEADEFQHLKEYPLDYFYYIADKIN